MFGKPDTALDSDDPVGPAAAATHTLVTGVESRPSAPSSLNMAPHEHGVGVGGPITELLSWIISERESLQTHAWKISLHGDIFIMCKDVFNGTAD